MTSRPVITVTSGTGGSDVCVPPNLISASTESSGVCGDVQHAIDGGWLVSSDGKPKLVALLSSAWEASLGVAHLHREGVIHGGLAPATCFLKAARNQRGFVVKVTACSLPACLHHALRCMPSCCVIVTVV